MEKLNNLVQFKTEDGETIEMVVLKEFEQNKNRYAILMDMNECACGDDCSCEGEESEDSCDCGGGFYIFKIEKDNKDKDVFKPIVDEKELKKVLKEAEKVIG